jgi:Zn-dependent protease with chaperone function
MSLFNSLKIALISFLFLTQITSSFAQNMVKMTGGCSYKGDKLPLEVSLYEALETEEKMVNEIINSVGLPQNFIILSSPEVDNACATILFNTHTKKYDRVIIYNPLFILTLQDEVGDWAVKSVLAHEIGHHLAGHSFGTTVISEQEADRFAGFILSKMGATEKEALSAIEALLKNTPPNSTHPPYGARYVITSSAWREAKQK